jgi:hypothetical protein
MSPSQIVMSRNEVIVPRRSGLIDVSLLIAVTGLLVWALLL